MSSDVLSTTCIPNFYRYTDPKAGEVTVDACPQNDSLIYEGNFRAVLLTLGETATDGIHLGHNGDVDIGGHVWSNSKIDLENPTHMVMKAGRVWAWGSCNRPGNIEMPPGVAAVCNASTKPEFASGKPKVALDPADPSLGHVADWQPAEAAPASFIQPAFPVCTANSMTLQPGVYYDGDEFSTKLNACDNVTLSPGVYYLNFPAGKDEWGLDNNVVGPACDASGQGVQIVFADSAHIKLSGTLTLPCGRSATPTGPNIALYGLKSDIAGPGAQSYTLRPTWRDHGVDACVRTPARRRSRRPPRTTRRTERLQTSRCPATRRLPSSQPDSTRRGYPGGIPLKLRIAHREDNNKATASRTRQSRRRLDVHRSPLTRQQNMAIETKDVNCAGFNAVAPFEVTYSVQAGNQAVNGQPRRGRAHRRASRPDDQGPERMRRQGTGRGRVLPAHLAAEQRQGQHGRPGGRLHPAEHVRREVQQHRQLQDRHCADCAICGHRHQPEPRRHARDR